MHSREVLHEADDGPGHRTHDELSKRHSKTRANRQTLCTTLRGGVHVTPFRCCICICVQPLQLSPPPHGPGAARARRNRGCSGTARRMLTRGPTPHASPGRRVPAVHAVGSAGTRCAFQDLPGAQDPAGPARRGAAREVRLLGCGAAEAVTALRRAHQAGAHARRWCPSTTTRSRRIAGSLVEDPTIAPARMVCRPALLWGPAPAQRRIAIPWRSGLCARER